MKRYRRRPRFAEAASATSFENTRNIVKSLLAQSIAVLCVAGSQVVAQEHGTPWKRHVIDDSSRGADGVRFADANGDGLPDIATAWEEGGNVKVYLNPGGDKVKMPWPSVTVGQEADGEDAVLVDVDQDGAVDVVSCHEGKTRTVFVHWAPKDKDRYLDPKSWKSEPFPALADKEMWMFCLPVEQGLVFGSKGHYGTEARRDGGSKVPSSIGLLRAPANRRDLAAWKWVKWADAGWTMSLVPIDLNDDGKQDVLMTDRYGAHPGVWWYENPGGAGQWKQHSVVEGLSPVFFLSPAKLEGDRQDIVVPMSREILWLRMDGSIREKIPLPDWVGDGKAVSAGDIDGDGKVDLVFTCEHATAKKGGINKSGVAWMKRTPNGWRAYDISGPEGIKFDLCPLIDLDGDGDLDVVTTEEREGGKKKGGLGVVWYENPSR